MDGLADDSPFILVISARNLIGRLLDDRRFLLTLTGVLFLSYVLGSWLDLIFILVFSAWNYRALLSSWTYSLAGSELCSNCFFVALITWISIQLAGLVFTNVNPNRDGDSGTYLIPCRTTHTRSFPKKHSFSYSYLVVGTPVELHGNINGILCVNNSMPTKSWLWWAWSMRAWFAVDSADYLQRGHNTFGLRGKLDSFLESQGVNSADFPHAFLVTAPKFLRYHFNPVSFWYLYSPDQILSAMVLEVSNTFGERRSYLVARDFAADAGQLSHHATPNHRASASWVKSSWKKDFHVSPFNSRKGSYSLLASDPLNADMKGFRGIDITINLTSSKGRPKLVARLFSDGEAVDPSTMSLLRKAQFIQSWFWVGLFTLPRIVKEAAVLLFRQKLHVWYRPEPLKNSTGRLADSNEKILETFFRAYLRFLVEQSPNSLTVRYLPVGIIDAADETFTSPSSHDITGETEHVKVKILTPVFYSRFVHYAHDIEAIFSELAENCTVWVDKPDVLPNIFLKKRRPPMRAPSVADFLYFKLIQRLRRRPDKIVRPMTSAESRVLVTKAIDIRGFRISPMDAFVLEHCDSKQRISYRSTVARLFVADRLFLGSVELLYITGLLVRAGIACWWSAYVLSPSARWLN